MSEKFLSSIVDQTQSITTDPSALLTMSTINGLHFPDLTTSGISETSNAGRPISLNLDGVGMCESMTESFCSTTGFDETALINMNNNVLQSDALMTNSIKLNGKKDPLTESYIKTQKKRRSRKAQYDATTDGFSLEKIETVPINEDQIEPDDAWLFEIPDNENKSKSNGENIFSWVHKEFKENEINANKHRLLCKLDDMSHARTIRSISCHNFPSNQRSESVKRSSTEQQVNQDSTTNTRLNSPLRSSTPLFNGNGNTRPTSPISSSPLRHTVTITNGSNLRSRDVSREREPLDFTDLEVMAKVQLENLRQSERQGPLSKRFDRAVTKPPVVPRNGTKPNNHRRSNTQTIVANVDNGFDVPDITEPKFDANSTQNRNSIQTAAAATTNRNRTSATPRTIQSYRGSQTSYINNNATPPKTPSNLQRNVKKTAVDLGTTFTAKQFAPSNENNFLNDLSNKPLTTNFRAQAANQRRTGVVSQTSVEPQMTPSASLDMTVNVSSTIPRSSSTLSQPKRSGIPMMGKSPRTNLPAPTRTNNNGPSSHVFPTSQSTDNMMNTRQIRPQTTQNIVRPKIPDATSPSSSWNEGCY